jgi:Putative zinc-finger
MKMRCKKAQEYLGLDLDGVIPPDVTVEVTNHLDGCTDCREFREDLLLGRRILQATEPELPENFDWKLQLRLNQAIKETAGEVAYPWEEKPADRWRWWRNFGSAAAVGMAAVLALAIFTGPNTQPTVFPVASVQQAPSLGGDRLPLDQKYNFGNGFGRSVSSNKTSLQSPAGKRFNLDNGWSGLPVEDLRTINNLKEKNFRLNQLLRETQRQNVWMKARLDTSNHKPLDLEEK